MENVKLKKLDLVLRATTELCLPRRLLPYFQFALSTISWRLSSEVDDFPAETISIGRPHTFTRPRHDDDSSTFHFFVGFAVQVDDFGRVNSDKRDDDEREDNSVNLHFS
jgi:hypothetical protein